MRKSIIAGAVLLACSSMSFAAVDAALKAEDKTYTEVIDLISDNHFYGIYVSGEGGKGINPSFEGETIKIANVQRGVQIKNGQTKDNGGLITDHGSSSLTLGKLGTTKTIDISATSESHALGITVMGPGNNKDYFGPTVNVNAEALKVRVEGKKDEGWAYGLHVANNSTDAQTGKATLNVHAQDIYVDAVGGVSSQAIALVAMSQGVMNLDGNLYVNTLGGNGRAIVARGGAELNINQSGKNTVVLNGDISFDYDAPTSGTPVDANVNIVLSGSNSSWTGNTLVSWDWGSKQPTDD